MPAKKRILILLPILICLAAGVFIYAKRGSTPKESNPLKNNPPPEISGWIAWWEEAEGSKTLETQSKNFHEISPYWYDIDESFSLKDMSMTTGKSTIVKNLTDKGIEVMPLINTSLGLKQLSPVFKSPASEKIISQIVSTMLKLHASGADIDLEEISPSDRAAFAAFLSKLHDKLKSNNLKLSVSVLAQTSSSTGDGIGTLGVDLAKVGAIADRVNILAYDYHSDGSDPGPITTISWLKDILNYSLGQIPKEKIVIGIPMYGYNWHNNTTSADPYSYQEFITAFGNDKNFSSTRDEASAELKFSGQGQEGWLADHISDEAYIKTAQAYGLNRFMIWQIGGMDQDLFK